MRLAKAVLRIRFSRTRCNSCFQDPRNLREARCNAHGGNASAGPTPSFGRRMSLAQAVAQSTELDRAAGGTPDLRVLGSERGWITKRPDAGEHDVCGRLQHLPGVLH